jgi:DNA (cytosine-5)-methyltransferase 1
MEWGKPSSTITAGCLSPSKGRFGHPDEVRTISLREAALLQTFPSDYRFVGSSIDRVCSVVGNALPCVFAESIAAQVRATIVRALPWLPERLLTRRRTVLERYG